MASFERLKEGYQQQFARSEAQTLQEIFGRTDLTPFWIADMDFEVAPAISTALNQLVERGIYAYELANQEEYQAIANWNQQRHHFALDTKAFIQVPSVLTGIAILIRELTQVNDGVLIQTPVYHQFVQVIQKANRKVISNPLQIVAGKYEMDFVDLERKLQREQVKIILLCNPHNPIGRVWKKEELEKLVALANQYKAIIVSDEIHGDIIHQGHQFNSIISLQQDQHLALLGSPAKTFGMQSISNGYIYIPQEERKKKINHTVEAMYLNHGNALTAYATIAAFNHGGPWLDELLTYLAGNIAWIQQFLAQEMPLVKMFAPEGTYQIWLDFSALGLSPEALDQLLVAQAKLALSPGTWFDQNCVLFRRMNIASPLSKIQKAFHQLQSAYQQSS